MICSLNSRKYHLKENTGDNAKNDKIAFIVTRGEEESCDATGPSSLRNFKRTSPSRISASRKTECA